MSRAVGVGSEGKGERKRVVVRIRNEEFRGGFGKVMYCARANIWTVG